jgi:ribosomal protein S18 acetylase RimI-like enzyme
MDNKAKKGAPQISIREFTDLRDVRPFVSDKRYDRLPLRAILGIVRQKGLQKVGVDIADCDGAPAGCVAFQWDYRGDSRSCYLFALFVKPEFRRKGVGERLVKSFCDNYRKVVLGVEGGNEPAVRLYKKLGFEFTGENEPVEDKDIKVMERTKKFSIKYNSTDRTFSAGATSSAETRTFDDGGKRTFWQKHKGKILAGAALATLGGLGYLNKDKVVDTYETLRYKIFMDEDDFWKEAKNVVIGGWSKDNLEDRADSLMKCAKYIKHHWKDGGGTTAKTLLKQGIDKGIEFCEGLMNSDFDKGTKDTIRTVYFKLKNLAEDL